MENWAKWYLREMDGSSGYSPVGSKSFLNRMMEKSSGSTYNHRDLHAEMSEAAQDAVAIESLLLDMEQFEEFARNAVVLRERFAGKGINEEKAARMGMSRKIFQDRLDQGLVWMSGAIQSEIIMQRQQKKA